MKVRLLLLLTLLLIYGVSNASIGFTSYYNIDNQIDTSVISLSRNATVRIIAYDDINADISYGTGFFVNDNSTIATCFHVIGKLGFLHNRVFGSFYKTIKCITSANDTIELTPKLNPKPDSNWLQHDFAVLEFKNKAFPLKNANSIRHLSLNGNIRVFVGEVVYFSGFPLSQGLITNTGMISGFSHDNAYMYIQGPVNSGNSGGAILDSKKNVIGILDFKMGGTKNLQPFKDSLNSAIAFDKNKALIAKTVVQTNKNKVNESMPQLTGNAFTPSLQMNLDLLNTVTDYLNAGVGGAIDIKYLYRYFNK
ncbi:MAG: serine protease [Bacteroidia bacterium]